MRQGYIGCERIALVCGFLRKPGSKVYSRGYKNKHFFVQHHFADFLTSHFLLSFSILTFAL
jgi:hypothetical protein